MQTCRSHSSTMHVVAEKMGCLREGQLSRPPQLCCFPDKHLTGHVPGGAVGGNMTTKLLWAGAAPRVWDVCQPVDPGVKYPVLDALSSFCSFPPPVCSSGSSLRKEKGQPVWLCGLYFYGMLLLKEHSCIAARQTCPSARAQVCSRWVARLYFLKNIQKTP